MAQLTGIFPNSVWDGSTNNRNRVGPNAVVEPNDDDWDRAVAEIISIENFLFIPTFVEDENVSIIAGVHPVAIVNAASAPVEITLPAASSQTGMFSIKKVDSSVNTVTISSTDLIDGESSYLINTQYTSVTLVSDGTTYHII